MRWNTWDASYPACMLDIETGLAVRVSAFSAAEGRATDFRFNPSIGLGPHTVEGSYVEVELQHAGSRARLRFSAGEAGALAGELEVLDLGEWALRFWLTLEFGFAGGAGSGGTMELRVPGGVAAYSEPPVALALVEGGAVAFTTATRPVTAHLYEDRAEALKELERFGYYYRPPRRERGRWAVLRFNAVTPRIEFAVAPGEYEETALAGLARTSRVKAPPPEDAIRDVVAWNTVWDRVHDRPYTAATRAWVADRFGGWIVWQIDAFFNAMLAAHAGDGATARANLEVAMACRTDSGMLAALRSGLTDWVDRSHPPIGAHALWFVVARTGDDDLLGRCFPVLARAFEWWFEARDGNADGLLEYGSSPVGDGHFVHTKLAALDESSTDNSPIYDEATFDERTHTLDMSDVGLNSLLAHEGEVLAMVAERLGRGGEAAAMRERAAALAGRVREMLWDDDRGIFANRLWDGRFAKSVSPTSFYPMLAGIATREQGERMVEEWLLDPSRFGGEFPTAGTPHEDPASLDNVYWRGRVWPPYNYLVYRGLRRYGFDGAASELARKGAAMFDRAWAERRSYENFNQRTGEGGDSVDADPFYTWGALLPMIAELDQSGDDPFDALRV